MLRRGAVLRRDLLRALGRDAEHADERAAHAAEEEEDLVPNSSTHV